MTAHSSDYATFERYTNYSTGVTELEVLQDGSYTVEFGGKAVAMSFYSDGTEAGSYSKLNGSVYPAPPSTAGLKPNFLPNGWYNSSM